MDRQKWLATIGRITPEAPIDLDPPADGPPPIARAMPDAPFAPSAKLWQREAPCPGRIGIRITAPVVDPARLAAQLAAAALERGIEPVILSHLELSGFERFGFRVERITAPGQEEELAGLWDLATIIDAADATDLG